MVGVNKYSAKEDIPIPVLRIDEKAEADQIKRLAEVKRTRDNRKVAQALNDAYYKPGCVVGKSMNTIDNSSVELIEIAVGRF